MIVTILDHPIKVVEQLLGSNFLWMGQEYIWVKTHKLIAIDGAYLSCVVLTKLI